MWVIYERPNYKGFQYVLSPGEYADNQQWMAFNDNVKSCRTVKNVRGQPTFPNEGKGISRFYVKIQYTATKKKKLNRTISWFGVETEMPFRL